MLLKLLTLHAFLALVILGLVQSYSRKASDRSLRLRTKMMNIIFPWTWFTRDEVTEEEFRQYHKLCKIWSQFVIVVALLVYVVFLVRILRGEI